MADPIADWMVEVSTALTNLSGRQQAVEKSVDQNTVAVTNAANAAASAASALTRIANTEEERLAFQKEQEKHRVGQVREDMANRTAWVTKIVTSRAFESLCGGLVFLVLQALGVGYLVQNVLPTLSITTTPAHNGGIAPPDPPGDTP